MKFYRFAAVAALAFSLAACAGSVSAPVTVHALTAEQRAGMRISDVTADAASGVEMSDGDFAIVCDKVKAHMQEDLPGTLTADGAYRMRIHFTRFDRGSALARAILIGLGQIRIEATVDLLDASGTVAGQYKVEKQFAIGGVVGASTSVEDVEDGFAKSVVEIVKMKA
ncbi:MAG TPA: DUF4410 domain-containing protein [Rhizomicrobium sp.]|nr:DUF4410 domain-containing protein [Rhizomicrobium sp.]